LTKFFEDRGITVSTISMYGGLNFTPEIQKSIDAVAQAAQQKTLNKELVDAQKLMNEKISLEAEGQATKTTMEAKAQADAKLLLAESEAKSIELVNKALTTNSSVLTMRTIEKWDGKYPTMLMGGSMQLPSLQVQMPMQVQPTITK